MTLARHCTPVPGIGMTIVVAVAAKLDLIGLDKAKRTSTASAPMAMALPVDQASAPGKFVDVMPKTAVPVTAAVDTRTMSIDVM